MTKYRIDYKDAYRVLGGVNHHDRIEYERIRFKMKSKIKVSATERSFVSGLCEKGRLLSEQAPNDAFARLFSQDEKE